MTFFAPLRFGSAIALTLFWGALLGSAACGGSSSSSGSGGSTGQCAESPCKLTSPQCGCADGQRCTVDGQGARYCALLGTAKAGEACSGGTTDCVAGAVCIGLSASVQVCQAFCTTDADCGTGLCARHLSDGKGGQVAGVTLCTEACDPILPSGCPEGTGCVLQQEVAGQKRWFTQCAVPQGAATEGMACSATALCAPGLACAATPSGNVCHKLCDVKAATGCTAPSKCVSFDTPVMLGTTEIGACQ